MCRRSQGDNTETTFDALAITASADGGRVRTPAFVMSFSNNHTVAPADMEQMHLALNRERMAVAAIAVADAVAQNNMDTARSVIKAARSVLVGGVAACTPVSNELTELENTLHDADLARICSYDSSMRARTQSNFVSNSTMSPAGKGASGSRYRMGCRKML